MERLLVSTRKWAETDQAARFGPILILLHSHVFAGLGVMSGSGCRNLELLAYFN
jgi:hypothetical protein